MGLSKIFDNSVVAMVLDLWHHWCTSIADSIKALKILWSMADIIENLAEYGRQCLPRTTKFSMTL